ncbi:hypothetical protein BYT27DRAFT_7255340 [Phlegmacium glaucopus]|nr:hypothetical protein BYT27DRAFT_7255340 [Phlegmacium glaucopus]
MHHGLHDDSTSLEEIASIEHEDKLQSQPGTTHHLPHDVSIISKQSDSDPPSPIIGQSIVEATSLELAQPSGPPLIQRLPIDLLFEIFIRCLPHDDFQRPNKHEAPLLLAQVCTLWRKISLDTRMLWASLEIPTEGQSSDGETLSPLVDLNDLWLSRSGQCPLSLSLRNDCIRVLDTIRTHSTHLRRLKMTVSERDCIVLPDDVHLPLLETFEMFTEESLEPDLVQSLSCCLKAAPRLKSFTWTNDLAHALQIKLNWSNLTHIKLNTVIDLQDFLPMFSEAKVMTHITFGFIMTGHTAVYSSVVLPELRSLIICAGDNPGPVFDAITTPKLKELFINSRYFWPHSSVLAFLQRSACPLESFNLYFPPLNEAQFIKCLKTVQRTLKEFTIHCEHPVVTDDILEWLTDTGNEDILCPKVEVIALYDCISCSPGQVATMAQSRLKPDVQGEVQATAKATCVSLKVIEMYDIETEARHLRPLRSLGLILKVYSASGAEIEMEPEDVDRLRRLREEGLVMSDYEWIAFKE